MTAGVLLSTLSSSTGDIALDIGLQSLLLPGMKLGHSSLLNAKASRLVILVVSTK
jgi:hypothetical protein